MFQISRYGANTKQMTLLTQLDRFIRNCPLNEQITLEQKDYDELRLLMPNLLRNKEGVEMKYSGKLLKCRGINE